MVVRLLPSYLALKVLYGDIAEHTSPYWIVYQVERQRRYGDVTRDPYIRGNIIVSTGHCRTYTHHDSSRVDHQNKWVPNDSRKRLPE